MKRRPFGIAVLVVTLLAACFPLLDRHAELPIWQHHLLHAGLIAGGALGGIFITARERGSQGGSAFWLLPALFAPMLAMFAMWPSAYSYFEVHPYGHVLEHLVLIALAYLATTAAETYAAGLGWIVGGAMLFMAVAAARGFGVTFGNGG
ncbi:MAG: hypothetical protein HKL92_07345 [Candidatus Eremiobacteraeota bacterium]|nr:hypothetical protein [Candidatus Eremiobacteraeota bacterium]NNM93140.1 hypothetical protein [Candidatus Eremiobacteraeota bacterium]